MKTRINKTNALFAYNVLSLMIKYDNYEDLPEDLRTRLNSLEYAYSQIRSFPQDQTPLSRQVIMSMIVTFVEDKRRYATN
jgi:hypothetical protein